MTRQTILSRKSHTTRGMRLCTILFEPPRSEMHVRMYYQKYEVGGLQSSESMRSQGNTSAGSGYSSCAFPARYLFMRRCVEWLKPSDGTTLRCFVRHVCTVVRTCTTGLGPIALPIESWDGRFGDLDTWYVSIPEEEFSFSLYQNSHSQLRFILLPASMLHSRSPHVQTLY